MIYSVIVTNYLGESLKIELANPKETGFAITKIDGIGAGVANINTTELATNDGSLFNSSRVTERNITIEMTFMEAITIEETRHRTYKYFPVKRPLTLTFETDTRVCSIDGYVESNEADIFSETEGCSISIICPNPYFRSTSMTSLLFYGVDPLFEFPFENNHRTTKLIEFGQINRFTDRNIEYEGDTETGVVIKAHALGPFKNLRIYKIQSREVIKIYTDRIATIVGSNIQKGDDIVISTESKNQYIKFIRAGKETNVLNSMDRSSNWFKLSKGDNVIAYTADEGLSNLEFTVEYRTLYAGV